ncbi:MAG TPA: hypothetical protein VGF39_17845 [Stellaceae bacterium]
MRKTRRWPFPGERDRAARFPFFYSPFDCAACRRDYAADLAKACEVAEAATKRFDRDFELVLDEELRAPANFRRLTGREPPPDPLVDVFYRRHPARIVQKNRAPGRWPPGDWLSDLRQTCRLVQRMSEEGRVLSGPNLVEELWREQELASRSDGETMALLANTALGAGINPQINFAITLDDW